MVKKSNILYDREVSKRLKELMKICDLTISGLNAFSGVSDSHLYALVNGNRKLSLAMAKRLGNMLNFDANVIFNLNKPLPDFIRKSENLNKFKLDNEINYKYFISAKEIHQKSNIALQLIENSKTLEQPRFLREIRIILNNANKTKFTSDELSKILNYLVTTGKIQKKREPLILKSGRPGKRIVDVFYI